MAYQHTNQSDVSRRHAQTKVWLLFAGLLVAMAAVVYWQRDSWQLLFGAQDGIRVEGVPAAEPADPQGFDPIVVIPRSFPPITDVPLASAEEVTRDGAEAPVRDDELVLGVAVNGEARAYPINMLTGPQREIINDMLGGAAIAATW